jgi:hypothetical protein
MEINGRLWGSLALAVKSGVDFPGKLVDLYTDESKPDSEPTLRYALGVRSHDVGLEVAWIASVLGRRREYAFLPTPRRRQALGAALSLLDPRDGFDVLSLRDPRPGVAELGGIVRKGFRRITARAAPGVRLVFGKSA